MEEIGQQAAVSIIVHLFFIALTWWALLVVEKCSQIVRLFSMNLSIIQNSKLCSLPPKRGRKTFK
ncbi:hypothetical protein DT075_07330 [Bacillus licheniformis]|nr:hypothetical protein DT075_07330 [Bacillus licheniformis]